MDYAANMNDVLRTIGIRTSEEMSHYNMRKCRSEMQHVAPSRLNDQSANIDAKFPRRFSEPCIASIASDQFEANNRCTLPRRSSSLESILSKASRSSGVAMSPISTPDVLTMKLGYLDIPGPSLGTRE